MSIAASGHTIDLFTQSRIRNINGLITVKVFGFFFLCQIHTKFRDTRVSEACLHFKELNLRDCSLEFYTERRCIVQSLFHNSVIMSFVACSYCYKITVAMPVFVGDLT